MSSPTSDGLKQEIDAGKMAIGNKIVTASGAVSTVSSNLFIDANGCLDSGNVPFALPLFAGLTDTSFSVLSVRGQATLTAADAMHQTLVSGASGSLTTVGFLRVTITDDAGNLTNGAYYIPFGTLA